jgi:tetratricopeptide (TPR) repeat protein
MKVRRIVFFTFIALLVIAVVALLSAPPQALDWRVDKAKTYLRVVFNPVRAVPTVNEQTLSTPSTAGPFVVIPLASSSPRQTKVDVPLPQSKLLTPPFFDKQKDYQGWNNCGPATLALALRYWGWQGDQYKVDAVVKPFDQDKNVNIEELASFTEKQAGLQAAFRVAGDQDTLKRFIAAGYPVMVETSFKLSESFWPGDDRWSSHFVLLTGYDDAAAAFTAQDVYLGPDTSIPYAKLTSDWQSFNYIYMVVFPADSAQAVAALFADDWSATANWQRAAALASELTRSDPQNAFAWFNLGSSLVALQQYDQAWLAFERARLLGLPQRMLRYQFSPFIAAFETAHIQDLLDLTSYALNTTPNSEEALYWQGKAFLALDQKTQARDAFLHALSYRPGYLDAIQALNAIQ